MKSAKSILLCIFILQVIVFSSCTKEPDQVGLGLITVNEKLSIGYTDTISLDAYSFLPDTIRTDEPTYGVVGSLKDEIFGTTTTSIYTQFKLSSNKLTFGISPVFDSAFLYLPISAVYGDTLSPLTVRVYPLLDTLSYDGAYYSNSTIPYDPFSELGSETLYPYPKATGSIKIALNSKFGHWLLHAPPSALVDNNTFTQYFKGLYITPDIQTSIRRGAMVTIDLSSGSTFSFYYHNNTDTTNISFAINSGCARFLNYNHYNFKNAMPALKEQIAGNKAAGKQYLFAQSMAGPRIRINLPDFKNYFKDKPVILNEAKLVFKNISSDTIYRPPSTMALFLNTAAGNYSSNFPEQGTSVTNADQYFFDGTWHPGENNYQFRLTLYIQALMSGKRENLGLWLTTPSSGADGAALGFFGTSNGNDRAKLVLKYTYLK